jgi:hypothetical protein
MSAQAAPEAWACPTCGASADAVCAPLTALCVDASLVIQRLEAAGATLLAMRDRSPWPAGFRSGMPEVLHDAREAYGWSTEPCRAALPDAVAIDAMDDAYRWLALIPQHRHVLRRIVAARSLVHPLTGRHIVHWRRLGEVIRADYRAAQRWHAQGIGEIVRALSATHG